MPVAAMTRGANVSLTREIPSLTGVVLAARLNAGSEVVLAANLVSAAILCDVHRRALTEEHFVFFNQATSPDGSVAQRTDATDGDQAQVEVRFPAVPATVDRVVIVVYINDGPTARRTLGQLKNCEIRVLNLADGVELTHSENLATELTSETAISLGELYRHGDDWKFRVLGQGYADGVAGIATDYGLAL